MADFESEVPMTKMYVVFESDIPTARFPEMRERIERLGAHLARISFSNEQLSIFDFERDQGNEANEETVDWFTLDHWTNNYLLDYLRVHPSDRPGTWPTRAWHTLASMVKSEHVKVGENGEVSLHREGIANVADRIKQGNERKFTGTKSKELLFLFVRNHAEKPSKDT